LRSFLSEFPQTIGSVSKNKVSLYSHREKLPPSTLKLYFPIERDTIFPTSKAGRQAGDSSEKEKKMLF